MKFLRVILGILVMIAGILGLLLSLAGLIGVWMVKPTVSAFLESTLSTLDASVTTSQTAMESTSQALGATVDSVDALSVMLEATADSIVDTRPVLEKVNSLMSEELPASMQAAIGSLESARQGAQVLEGAITSLNTFSSALSAIPFVGSAITQPVQEYDPDQPLADSLGELAASLEDLPDKFTEMAADLDKADDNLETIKDSLVTMSDSVTTISRSLSDYQAMVVRSESSMDNLKSMLSSIQQNLAAILNGVGVVLNIFFFWLLAAQVVILSQGWELYRGTAGRMEGGPREAKALEEVGESAEKETED